MTWLLRDRILTEDDNQTLLNRAERILRPAVIARKVSHCSKNERGAHASSVFLSVFQTSRKKLRGAVQSIPALLPGMALRNFPAERLINYGIGFESG